MANNLVELLREPLSKIVTTKRALLRALRQPWLAFPQDKSWREGLPTIAFICTSRDEVNACRDLANARGVSVSVVRSRAGASASNLDNRICCFTSLRELNAEIECAGHLIILQEF